MILRSRLQASLLATAGLFTAYASAAVAPEITTVIEGYNMLAKLPCVGCPFLYQDTSKGEDGGWKKREDGNALLLNISLPYTAPTPSLSINNGHLLPHANILPRIYAPQVLADSSTADLSAMIARNSLDSPGGAFFGLSYRYHVRRVKKSHALSLIFDVSAIYTDLTDKPFTHELNDAAQKLLEVVLLQRPLLGAGDAAHSWEIVRAGLVEPDSVEGGEDARVMEFLKWDGHGRKGTTAHLVNSASDSLLEYITSGVVGLLVFVMALIALFVVICLLCIFGCGLSSDEYGSAQRGKRRISKRGSGSWHGNDVEKAKGRFRTAEELGLRGGGKVVGVGKSD